MELDHAGLATQDADELSTLYEDLLQCERVHSEVMNEMQLTFLDLGNTYLELIEPLNGGPIADYLAENGPGIHHIALETENLVNTLGRVSGMGVELIDEEPRPGAWGHDVAFCHPASTGGILVEFVEH